MKFTNGDKISKQSFKRLDTLSPAFKSAFGDLTHDFRMIVWGQSGNGKSNLIMQFANELLDIDPVLYLSIEESRGPTIQELIFRYIADEEKRKKLKVAYTNINYDALITYLKKPRTPRFVFIDSVQYLDMDHRQYKRMVDMFPNKAFVFVSHAKGKLPDGKTADKIRYDAGVKVMVEGDVAFVKHSRYGGEKNYVIYEKGAKAYWGKNFKKASEERKFQKTK